MFKRTAFLVTLAIAQVTILHIPNHALADPVKFKVRHAASGSIKEPICPNEVIVDQKARPYYEGGYTIDGSAKLDWLAGKFKVLASDDFSVTWVAKLQPKYQSCHATAGISNAHNEDFRGHSYLRMRFAKGNVYLILDMTAMYDANDYTPVIVKKEVKDGNPIWTWSGTD